MEWWIPEAGEVLKKLETTQEGLSDDAARRKREEAGPNELEQKKRKPAWKIFLDQFKDFMILVLLAAAVISGIAGDMTDTIIIAVIIMLNAIVGFVQENKAEKAMEALRKMSGQQAHVIRNNKPATIPVTDLVPGDIVTLEAGNVVPADLRLLEAHSLRIDESALTGESVPAEKTIKPVEGKDVPVGDRLNMAFKSTLVANGRAKAVVVATGMQTEVGSIAKMLSQDEGATPLQKRMTDFGRKVSFLVIGICVLFFGVGYLMKEDPMELLLTSISLAVAAIPEALPALITVTLASGAKRLVKQNALIRKLSAVETLGSVTFICSDKTGTLTQNKMKVTSVEPADTGKLHEDFDALFVCMALNHDVKQGDDKKFTGDPTEIAIAEEFIAKHSEEKFNQLASQLQRTAEIPFDSDRKRMTTAHEFKGRILVTCKGAAEAMGSVISDNKGVDIQAKATEISKEGMRVIAFGYKILEKLPEPFDANNAEKDLVFAGLTGMIDPPREEVKGAIEECKTAGITTVMITGDHPETASSIARQLGILSEKEIAVTGKELQAMNDSDFEQKVESIRVYARVSPEQKLRIVKALQKKDHFVSMTGDGVNDSPSLKAADIGVAMGITGTDVTKEASDMVLLDDNFTTIVKAVREGRHIYDNIRKFVKYIMTCNGAEIWTMFVAPLVGLPIPLLPIHILWINLVTDGLPGLALGNEKPEPDIMQRPPRKSNESLFSGGAGVHIIWVGILMAAVTLGAQAWAVNKGYEHWQTIVFTVLSLSQLGHVMAIRSERQSLFSLGLFSNKPLLGAVVLTLLLQLGVIYLPWANEVFKTQPLTLGELGMCVGLSMVVLIGVEIEKLVKNGNRKPQNSRTDEQQNRRSNSGL
jgi:Ca2+-transporting ATPase